MKACVKASEMCIPQNGIGVSSKQIPGWSEHIEPYRERSIFWHNLWKDNGCPAIGWLAEIRKKTLYIINHYTLRQIHKEDTILANKLAHSVINNKTNDFWSSVKKIKGFQSVSVNCIDNVVGGENISNYFINKYSGYEKQDVQTLVYHMNNPVSKQCN